MKILLTGAGGFAGNHLLENLVKQGHEVVGLYRKKRPVLSEQNEIKSLLLMQKDLGDSLLDIPSCEIIIHTAAAHPSNIPMPSTDDYLHSNIYAMNNLAKYAKYSNARLFIYLSSISIYGNVTSTFVKEDTPINVPSMYGLSKYVGEKILQEHEKHFPSVCIRLPGLVGKGNFNPWLGTVLKKALANEKIPVYNPDALFNNSVHLSELNQFIDFLLVKDFKKFNVFNLAASEPIKIKEVVETVVSLTNSKSDILESDLFKTSFYICIDKVNRILGFETQSTKKTISVYVYENSNT